MRHWVGLEWALLGLFVLSGFAGLVYQSVWTHYLGLILGHAAYAQTLVLAIFMGGMALGAWWVSRRAGNWKALILGYAIVELVIGVLGLAFHPIFVAYTAVSQQTVLPALGSQGLGQTYQWLSAAALILPQTMLLGATFPLLSAGYLRLAPAQEGRVLGGLYFSNSIGAAVGALVTTFALLPWVGMQGAMLTAGLLNVAVGLGAYLLWRSVQSGEAQAAQLGSAGTQIPAAERADAPSASVAVLGRVMVTATFLSGAFSFMYEVGWIRMLNQALGTTVHSFELMLAAFIAGLAFGGAWVRRRGEAIRDAVAYAGWAQVWMGIAALFSVVALSQSFAWTGWMMGGLARTETGYLAYSIGTAAIALLVMFPAAFFAGMTLPLFTMALLRRGAGESSIGRIYAANTLGAIVGVMLVVHVLIPTMGVRLAVTLAALGDAILGLYLLKLAGSFGRIPRPLLAGGLVLLSLGLSLHWGRVDPLVQASGVFRHGRAQLLPGAEVHYLRDGKTATVSVHSRDNARYGTISTNGKPDAGLSTSLEVAPSPDESTMLMLGALPLALHPEPRDIAVIGWGSGLTTHTVLGSSVPSRVDNIEIERAMVEGARLFGDRVARAYDDPRSHIIVDDARTYFSLGNRRYDVIISEPSNPWVSGVASLFTREFYALTARQLKEQGILVQWLHLYEINEALLATMLAALQAEFPHVDFYLSNSTDVIFVAAPKPLGQASMNNLDTAPLRAELARLGMVTEQDFQLRKIGNGELLRAYLSLHAARPHSDYFPEVSLKGPRSRFLDHQAFQLIEVAMSGLPFVDMVVGRPVPSVESVTPDRVNLLALQLHVGLSLRDSLLAGRVSTELATQSPPFALALEALQSRTRGELPVGGVLRWSEALAEVADGLVGVLPSELQADLWREDAAWLGEQTTLPEAASVALSALRATAARDIEGMRRDTVAALRLGPEALAPQLREQFFVSALIGALAAGAPGEVASLRQEFEESVMSSAKLASVRMILSAWADGIVSGHLERPAASGGAAAGLASQPD